MQEDSATFFLFWDFLALWTALLTFVGMEDGQAAAARVLLAAPVISPGAAFALYLGHVREQRVAAYIMAASDKTR